ncbi:MULTISPECIES: trehalose-phosphatase [Caldimonas]|uniref:trehalose-phosphatase n=1 Tax=Caldimonas TaxID=196013 RepID=UPI00037C704A|nr:MULTISPECIES: trehalose-phosphatase [Caldimonas]GIX24611.1 MAG: trehalose 6-phosphate phosphatase [Caldimonas sp.]
MHWPQCNGRPLALFLDFDGTLAELASRPQDVHVEPALIELLDRLRRQLEGALAIVTGRPVQDIDAFLHPLLLPVAGLHGAEGRGADGRGWRLAAPDLSAVEAVARALQAEHPGLQLEHKAAALAVHYRHAPEAAEACRQRLAEAIASDTGLELLHGKCVIEVKPAGVHKGLAIERFLSDKPFAGREPAFAGDDVTDEAGFATVLRLGGQACKVGAGPSCAPQRLASPAELHRALAAWSQQLSSCVERSAA